MTLPLLSNKCSHASQCDSHAFATLAVAEADLNFVFRFVAENLKAALLTSLVALLLVQVARVANALWLRRLRSPYRHLRQPSRTSLIFGNLGEFHKADLGVVPLAWAREFGGVVPFGGLLGVRRGRRSREDER